MPDSEIEQGIEQRIEDLGYELVDVRRAGNRTRPVLKIRIDRPDSAPGRGVTVDDCARVSRTLEAWLEGRAAVPERYVLEVSSPGVERPLVRERDWRRFQGERVALKGFGPIVDDARRVEGELIAFVEDGGRSSIRLRLDDEREVVVPLSDVASAHLVFDWK